MHTLGTLSFIFNVTKSNPSVQLAAAAAATAAAAAAWPWLETSHYTQEQPLPQLSSSFASSSSTPPPLYYPLCHPPQLQGRHSKVGGRKDVFWGNQFLHVGSRYWRLYGLQTRSLKYRYSRTKEINTRSQEHRIFSFINLQNLDTSLIPSHTKEWPPWQMATENVNNFLEREEVLPYRDL